MIEINRRCSYFIFSLLLPTLLNCAEEATPDSLSVNPANIEFDQEGGGATIAIQTNVASWKIENPATAWLQLSTTSGPGTNAVVNLTAGKTTIGRKDTLTITAGTAIFHIPISQKGDIYPSYNTTALPPDATGMTSTAAELAAKISLGWNVGNSLEAIGGETAWGNPQVTKSLIDLVKQNGFNAIRIPCSWNQYMADRSTAQLQDQWLDRVKEVVQYCFDNELYVLLNIHWDGGWLENNCTQEKQEENNAKQKAFWEQIASHLRDFDEHLLFASANEPNVDNAAQMNVLNSYHQTFINAVRSTGGRNSYRVLVIQGPGTDIDKTNQLMTSLPADEIENKLMVEVHYYTPWNFCGLEEDAEWGKMFYYWGKDYHSSTDIERNATWGEEDAVDVYFQKMKTQFVDRGIPVVMGEFAAIRRSSLTGDALTLHLASRAYYLEYVTSHAKTYGLLPFYWDNGGLGNATGLFDRASNTVFDQQAVDALVRGASD